MLAGLFPHRGSPTRIAFDLAFGIVAPPILFHLDLEWDPMPGNGGIRMLPFRPYTPLLALGAMVSLGAWISARDFFPWIGAFLAGPLLGCAGVALGIGTCLLPFSCIGMMWFGLGTLGFVPILTGLVYLDAGLEALAAGRRNLTLGPALAASACTGLLVAGLAAGAGRLVKGIETRETAVLLGKRPGDEERAVRRLRLLRQIPGIVLRELETETRRAEGPSAARLAGLYKEITGHYPFEVW